MDPSTESSDDMGGRGLNLDEIQDLARRRLPTSHYDYIAGGSGDEAALRGNREAFRRWRLVPRVLRGIDAVDLEISVLGTTVSMPLLLSPVAFQRLACPEGELASAAAARSAGTIFTLSTLSTRTIEEVADVTPEWWFQVYCYRDREITRDLFSRAEAAGAKALAITVDTLQTGRREADERNGFSLPEGVELVNIARPEGRAVSGQAGVSGLAAYMSSLWDPSLSWADIDWVAANTKLPILVKGILSPADAEIALEHGAQGIVVSNHGGRQLDYSIATLDALPSIVQAVGGRCQVFLDGGVRRGTDVIKALALGATAVMIGRPYIWGLAIDGQRGAERVLEMLRTELLLDMLLCGAQNPREVNDSLIVRSGDS